MISSNNMSSTFTKRAGTSGIRGQLYETKLLSLIYFRCKQDPNIQQFYLATNVDGIGAFDDICLRVKVKGYDKPLAVFLQAKHSNERRIDLKKYFKSYLDVRDRFKPSNDVLFKGEFDDIECLFVMYTFAENNSGEGVVNSSFTSILNNLIDTGGTAKQPYKKHDVKLLLKEAMNHQINGLAERMAEAVKNDQTENFQYLQDDQLLLRYHVILAQKVIKLTDIGNDGHRTASFRPEFFITKEESLILFKDLLYRKVLKNRKISSVQTHSLLEDFFKNPTDITKLAKLIVTVLVYDKNELQFAVNAAEDFKRQLSNVQANVSQSTVNRAVEMAAKEILSPLQFKVTAAFGNKDLTLKRNVAKIERRINYLTAKILELLDSSDANDVVTVDDSIDKGLLKLNGGLASAVGNIFVFDEQTKLMKFTDDVESLGNYAKQLHHNLKSKITNLEKYRFRFTVTNFPRLSFDYSQYEENVSKDFLNKLIFYTNQAEESVVGEILKREIEHYQQCQKDYFQVKTDSIFLNYHDAIQKWWIQPIEASYLTKESKIFEESVKDIIKDQLMSITHAMYTNKIKNKHYEFNENAVSSLNLQEQFLCDVIITKSTAFTVAKVIQHLNTKQHVVLDLEYILNLPLNDRHAILTELKQSDEKKVLIFVFHKILNYSYAFTTLKNIATAVNNRKTIFIVENDTSVEIINNYFRKPDHIVRDERNSLTDMSKDTQDTILRDAKVTFQGYEINLNLILDKASASYVEGAVLTSIINEDTIEVGKPINNKDYDEIKYIERHIKLVFYYVHPGRNKIQVNDLQGLEEDVIVLTAAPGMGKSTLLTHLSHMTKKYGKNPKIWIVRINLIEYSKEFSKWKREKTAIDTRESLNFLCQVILREKLGKDDQVEFSLAETDGVVYLEHCTGDQWTVFELKLFLYFYNYEELILLFDGFDEICPDYTDEVIQWLKTLRNYPMGHRIWVTSRLYNEVKNILETEFGASYEIEQFSHDDRQRYLNNIWKSSLILNELDERQLYNVHNFLEFMVECKNHQPVLEPSLHVVYDSAVRYLIKELKNTHVPLWRCDTNYDETYFTQENDDIFMHSNYDNSDRNPLHLLIMADFFVKNIKVVKNYKWNREINTFTFYESFLETKLKKIRYEEKNKIDVDISDNRISYDKERAEFILMFKLLSAYAILHESIRILFNKNRLKKVRDYLLLIESGHEKTGLVYTVSYDPIFTHKTFAEYFAVEYVCDLLNNKYYQEKCITFIFTVILLSSRLTNVRRILNFKIKNDKSLKTILENNKEQIFILLMEQGRAMCEDSENPRGYWAVYNAINENLKTFTILITKVFEEYVIETNLDEFIEIVTRTRILMNAIKENGFIISSILNIIRRHNESLLDPVLHRNFPFIKDRNYDEITSEEIVKLLHIDYMAATSTQLLDA